MTTATAETAMSDLAALLNGSTEDSGPPKKLAAPKKPRSTKISLVPDAPAKKGKDAKAKPAAKRTTLVRPDLSEAVLKRIKNATDKQHDTIRTVFAYDPEAKILKGVDADGDVTLEYIPSWEQGRMKAGVYTKGPGRRFVYLIDRGGQKSGHGFKYRSTQAETKLQPLEAKNAARLEREAKKAAA